MRRPCILPVSWIEMSTCQVLHSLNLIFASINVYILIMVVNVLTPLVRMYVVDS
jgi:hypothetical protein